MICYTVRCEFPAAAVHVAAEWLAWLQDQHVADVLAAGAVAAEIVSMQDCDRPTMEVRYRFPDRAAFDSYLEEHAGRLRQEGLDRFPPELGLEYSRSVGEVVAAFP